MNLLLYFAICLLATVIGAVCGVGGGVIIRPVMDAMSGLPVSQIGFLSGFTVLCMAVSSLLSTGRSGVKLDVGRTLPLSVGAAVGGVSGKLLFDWISGLVTAGNTVGIVQNVILAVLTAGTLLYVQNKRRIRARNVQSLPVILIIGFSLGLLSSFLGIGGGPFNLVVLFFFFSMDSKTAALNSLFIILLSQTASLLSTVIQGSIPDVDWRVLLIMAAGGVLGGIAGRKTAGRMDNRQTDQLFVVLLIGIILICIFNVWHYA